MAKKATRKNLRTVLEKLIGMSEQSTLDARAIVPVVNQMLDGLLENDFFGTEGQLDPRGDQRDE